LEGLMLELKCSTLGTWCEERTHLKRPWCWERLRAGGEGDDRGWDGWMASPTQWTWVWVDSRSWWWTGRRGVLWFMELQRVGHNWATELNWTELNFHLSLTSQGFPGGPSGKEPAWNAGDLRDGSFIPGSGRYPGGGYGDPNSMNRGFWQATAHRVTKSRTQLKWLSMLNSQMQIKSVHTVLSFCFGGQAKSLSLGINFFLNWTDHSSGVWDFWLLRKNMDMSPEYTGELNKVIVTYSFYCFFLSLPILRLWKVSCLTRKLFIRLCMGGLGWVCQRAFVFLWDALPSNLWCWLITYSSFFFFFFITYSSELPFGILLWHAL